jgi:hypothetical protein
VTRLKRQAGGGTEAKVAAASRLQRLLADDDLSGVRDAGALAQVPDTEWKSWYTFWSQVRALRDAIGPAERPVVLRSADARVLGSTLHVENRPNANLAYLAHWSNPTECAEWLVKDVHPGKYRLSLTHACANGNGGNYIVTVGGQTRKGRSRNSGGWQEYATVELGTVTLPAGDTTVSVRSEGVIQNYLMDLRSLTLTPVPEP